MDFFRTPKLFFFFLYFIERFIEIWFTYYKIHPFQVYGSIVLSIFPELSNLCHSPILELLHFHQPKEKSMSILFWDFFFFLCQSQPTGGRQLQMTKHMSEVLLKSFPYSSQESWKTGMALATQLKEQKAECPSNSKFAALKRLRQGGRVSQPHTEPPIVGRRWA